jgi:uncharacterized phiE125 gp8 family phage protein
MASKRIVAPTDYPVTLVEAKAQCRVDQSDEDTLLNGLIAAATDYVEQYTGTAIMAQTWATYYDAFTDAMTMPHGPVQSVTSVKYYDVDGVLQTASPTIYDTDLASNPQWVVRVSTETWPDTIDVVNAVAIEYVSGYVTVPPSIKHAILLLISQWYDNRAAATDKPVLAMSNAVEALLTNYRTFGF